MLTEEQNAMYEEEYKRIRLEAYKNQPFQPAYAERAIHEEKKDFTPLWAFLLACLILIPLIYFGTTMRAQGKNLFGIPIRGASQAEAERPETISVSRETGLPVAMDGSLTDEMAGTDPLSGRNVYYAGFDDCTVGPNNIVYLENMPENEDIYIAYEIWVNDKVLHSTGLIPSGKYSEWKPADELLPGTYDIGIKSIPYYSYDGENFFTLAYQPVNEITITITK